MKIVCVNKQTPTSLWFNEKVFCFVFSNSDKEPEETVFFCGSFLSSSHLGIFKISFVSAQAQPVTLPMIPAFATERGKSFRLGTVLDYEMTHATELIAWRLPMTGSGEVCGRTSVFLFTFPHSLLSCPVDSPVSASSLFIL